ncbi:hypothetical protein GUJ93_ZPchr0007g5147 [Zizania palustris]|uniref:Uncharacterized protein n=1 Tax=Zizania palustris TaxID=103762 RepID=A0A8J5TEY0_ZIZPA|nr:hypothetical protein GUJ93_ZPchr0007g5147 [Zizania palustris]
MLIDRKAREDMVLEDKCIGGDGRRADDLDKEMKEGEIRLNDGGDSGSETETDDEISRYVFQPRDKDDRPESSKRRRLREVVAEGPGAMRSPTPSSAGSDRIVSNSSVGAATTVASTSQGSNNVEPIPNVSTAADQHAVVLYHAPPLHAAALAPVPLLFGQARPS